MALVLTLPFPPSVNAMWRTPSYGKLAGRTMLSQEGRNYRKAVIDTIGLLPTDERRPFPADKRLSVQIDAWMPDKRRRDIDNLLKGALDALTAAGIWADDSQIDHLSIRRVDMIGGMLKVKVTEVV